MVFSSYLQKNPLNRIRGPTSSRSISDHFRILCLVLAALSFILSIAILGTVGHSYHVYKVQKAANNPWWLPLWPGHFDTTGTKALIGAGASVTLLNLSYIIVSVIPKFKLATRSLLNTAIAVVLSTASGLIAIFGIVLVTILNKRAKKNNFDTIQTWTCKFSKALPGITILGVTEPLMSNDKFGRLCTESRFGFWALVTVFILQLLFFLSAIAHLVTKKRSVPVTSDEKTEYSI